jgi:hypothetical protein
MIEVLPMEVPQMLNIHQRVLAIMEDLDYIRKGEKTVNGQYRFVSHDQVTAAIHHLLIKHRVNMIPSTETIKQDGNRTEVTMIITYVNVDNPADNYSTRFCGYGCDTGDKGPGKAVSYACKYAAMKGFHLETGDDPDNDAKSSYEPPKCQEFSSMLPIYDAKELAKLNLFLAHSAEVLGKHVEDVKRDAVKRMPDFIKAFEKWEAPKKKKEIA